eukprot:408963_1
MCETKPKKKKVKTRKTIKTGQLQKQSLHLHRFRERKVQLTPKSLYFWKKHISSVPWYKPWSLEFQVEWKLTEKLDLQEYDCVYARYDDKYNPAKFALRSSMSRDVRTFIAPSFDAMLEWIKCIKQAQQQYKHNWKCQFCTYLNENNKTRLCQMCGMLNKTLTKYQTEGTEGEKKRNDSSMNDTYLQLINMGFSDSDSKKASIRFPLSINKALKCVNKIRLKSSGVSTETKEALDDIKQNNDIKFIEIPIEMTGLRNCTDYEEFTVKISYCEDTLIQHIVMKAVQAAQKLYYPRTFRVYCIKKHSFIEQLISPEEKTYDEVLNTKITEYKMETIVSKGLSIGIENRFVHKIRTNEITCKYMTDNNTIDPNACPIYLSLKQYYAFTQESLQHLNEYVHFSDEFNEKTKCKHGEKCNAFVRLENGGDRLDDKCHVKLFRHPPRRRTIKLEENIKQFMINQHFYDNQDVYVPTPQDGIWFYNEQDGYLNALIFEVIYNGYKADLCLQTEDLDNDEFSILRIVDEKMKAKRHQIMDSPLNRAQMLAIILYTGCDCNFDLCISQRNGDFMKWKWFDFCLYYGIQKLSEKETGSYKLYSGLSNVKLEKKEIKNGYFITYVSTTWIKEVSSTFVGDKGMIIQVDESYRTGRWTNICDVSWISKFPDECEVLISRSNELLMFNNDFSCSILDEHNGIQ